VSSDRGQPSPKQNHAGHATPCVKSHRLSYTGLYPQMYPQDHEGGGEVQSLNRQESKRPEDKEQRNVREPATTPAGGEGGGERSSIKKVEMSFRRVGDSGNRDTKVQVIYPTKDFSRNWLSTSTVNFGRLLSFSREDNTSAKFCTFCWAFMSHGQALQSQLRWLHVCSSFSSHSIHF